LASVIVGRWGKNFAVRVPAAVAEIEAESRHHRLNGVAIRDLLEEGRRG